MATPTRLCGKTNLLTCCAWPVVKSMRSMEILSKKSEYKIVFWSCRAMNPCDGTFASMLCDPSLGSTRRITDGLFVAVVITFDTM